MFKLISFVAILLASVSAAAHDTNHRDGDALILLGDQTAADDSGMSKLSEFIVSHMPIVERFQKALVSGDRNAMLALASDDFHVVNRSNYEKRLSVNSLLDYVKGCEADNRMRANASSITIQYSCPKYQQRNVLYNFEDGRVSRIIIGEIPAMTIVR